MSSVMDLKNNIVDKVLELGADLKFLENPAFVTALAEVNYFISEINMEDLSVVLLDKSNSSLSFNYNSLDGDTYKVELSCPDNKTIKFVKLVELHSFVGDEGYVVRQKNVMEQIATLGEHGEVIIVTNKGAIDNIGCDNHHYNMNNSVERRVYTKRGVMYERENKNYATRKGEGYFHRVGAKEMLLLARQAFEYGPWADTYNKRTLLRREMFDTARLNYEDRAKDNHYYGVVPLSKENSLKDLFIAKEYNYYPMIDVKIEPLTEEEINNIISKESNELIAEGLRYFANGRTSYSYSSSDK